MSTIKLLVISGDHYCLNIPEKKALSIIQVPMFSVLFNFGSLLVVHKSGVFFIISLQNKHLLVFFFLYKFQKAQPHSLRWQPKFSFCGGTSGWVNMQLLVSCYLHFSFFVHIYLKSKAMVIVIFMHFGLISRFTKFK